MRALTISALAATLVFAAGALADNEERREMKIVVAGASSDDSAAIHWIGSGDADFDMQGMQVGETQSIVDESGRAVLVTREEEGFRFDVDGKSVVLPDMGEHEDYLTLADGNAATVDFDVEIVAGEHALATQGGAGVTVISGEPLDPTTQESIKAVLLSAGRDDTVTFVVGGGTSDARRVKVIRKTVEIEQ